MNSEYAKERAGLSQGNVSGLSAPTKSPCLTEQISDLARRIDDVESQVKAVTGRLFGYEDAPPEPALPPSSGVVSEMEHLIANAYRQLNRISDGLLEINRRL